MAKDSYTLTIKWGDGSCGVRCRLLVDGHKTAYCHGMGYDMAGTVVGDWIEIEFQEELNKLVKSKLYGLKFYPQRKVVTCNEGQDVPDSEHTRASVDGACGLSSIQDVLAAIGYGMRQVVDLKAMDVYLVERK